ncbi:glycosyltransferase family 2 protein [Polynucleobacter nymphae]|uniref:glycosyltransferase family 2 protein n=1 Tax=Polynucleobacter nymphae TaxID=2081043 RepID=UPI001C0AA187|nr:glycosyltransferase family 2 protein [Polynucleobacter nymphae]MBU3607776.1 glycosyltransferase [Polynucleobacter nymphae]
MDEKNKITTNYFCTVVTIVKNNREGIERTLKSIVSQSFTNFEYIVIDGGSSDGTVEIIRNYNKNINLIISEPDNGIYYAMNKAINLSRGKYIIFINSGDWLESDILEHVHSISTQEKSDVYYGLVRLWDQDSNIIGVNGATIMNIKKEMISHSSCFISKDVYNYINYDIKYKSAADYDLIFRILNNQYKFFYIEKIISNFVLGGISSTKLGFLETNSILFKYKSYGLIKYILKYIYIKLKSN